MKKGLLYTIIILVFVLVIGVLGVVFFYNSNLKAINEDESSEVIVEIKTGSTATDIAKVLKGILN